VLFIATRECDVVMFSVMSVCICLFCCFESLDLQKLYTQAHLQNIYVKVEYQGHGVKVIWA